MKVSLITLHVLGMDCRVMLAIRRQFAALLDKYRLVPAPYLVSTWLQPIRSICSFFDVFPFSPESLLGGFSFEFIQDSDVIFGHCSFCVFSGICSELVY